MRGLKRYKIKAKDCEVREVFNPYSNEIEYLVHLGGGAKSYIFSDREFNALFEEVDGCSDCKCNKCYNTECSANRCAECDMYSLKTDVCELTCETCAFGNLKFSDTCKECFGFSNWRKSAWPVCDASPSNLELVFNNDTKNAVFTALSNIQYNIYPSVNDHNKPILVVPHDNGEMRIPLGATIRVIDGKIHSYYFDKRSKESDKNGSI